MSDEEARAKELEKKKKGIRNSKLKKKLGEECVYCGCDNTLILTIDHIKPISRGGEDVDENKQVACFVCNQLKGGLTDSEFKKYMKALKLMKELNKIKLGFGNMGQPVLTFNGNSYPKEIKDLERRR